MWGLLEIEPVRKNVGTVVGLTPISARGLDGKTARVLKLWQQIVYLAVQGVLFHKVLVLIFFFLKKETCSVLKTS